jgi:hypothetical protein
MALLCLEYAKTIESLARGDLEPEVPDFSFDD